MQQSGPAWIISALLCLVLLGYAAFNVEMKMVSHLTPSIASIEPSHALRTSKQQNEKPTLNYAVDPKHNVHLVSTDSCEQDLRQLMSAALQLSLVRVGHKGPLTEIITGCTTAQKEAIAKLPTFYADYRVHFTPDFAWQTLDNGVRQHYYPYNKPFGLAHFLQHGQPKDDLAVALIDIDYFLLQPLEVNRGANWTRFYQVSSQSLRDPSTITDTVSKGIAIAQNMKAFLGGVWWNDRNSTVKDIVCKDKPCALVSNDEAMEYFEPSGTPYILTRSDMERVVVDYAEFTRKGRTLEDKWMVEMSAWGAAVANQNVKQTLVTHLGGATCAYKDTEYWDFLPNDIANPCEDDETMVLPRDGPVGIHYAMYYGGDQDPVKSGFAFYKYRIPKDITDCNSMLLAVPPPSEWTKATEKAARHGVWLECTAIKLLNHALLAIKRRTCLQGFNSFRGLMLRADINYMTGFPTEGNMDLFHNVQRSMTSAAPPA
ncbi:unnamed protein product [Aphanomyces euteiches]|uniref:Nucleotide-diphospho-sugar transferase domain-containing protein n=1 Tax=Aphanomyces euteiches TaxID=100861 RepID=A0A6G0W713_9STRA|nr:hypothetical protein Ae201684_018567 [Aphanomyces euteiches]